MPKYNKTPWPSITVVDVMAAAIQVHESQGFIKSGQGYTDHSDPENPVLYNDNKTKIVDIIEDPKMLFTQDQYEKANELINTINGKLMIKKMTNNLNSFEANVVNALSESNINKFTVSIVASLPHSVSIDKKREEVEDKLSSLKHSSQYFGDRGKRYDLSVEVMDVKFIQTSNIYMITTVYAKKDLIKFWWRDQLTQSHCICLCFKLS